VKIGVWCVLISEHWLLLLWANAGARGHGALESARLVPWGDLNLRVLCPGGGDKRAKRSTSAAGGLSTEWTWKYNTKHAKHGVCKEHRGAESARLVPWGRGQTREAQHERRQRAQHRMDLEVQSKTRKTWSLQGARGS
jgi:hypothetical protein